jgi:CoA:oxalate CoA-transferase
MSTALLADLGAEVVKVEPPQGDDYRAIGPMKNGQSALFTVMNRNKQSLVLDLKHADAVAVVHELARQVDVVVENFRPGVAERLGIGPKRCAPSIPGWCMSASRASARPARWPTARPTTSLFRP